MIQVSHNVQYLFETGVDFSKWLVCPSEGTKNMSLKSIVDRVKLVAAAIAFADAWGAAGERLNEFNGRLKEFGLVAGLFMIPSKLFEGFPEAGGYLQEGGKKVFALVRGGAEGEDGQRVGEEGLDWDFIYSLSKKVVDCFVGLLETLKSLAEFSSKYNDHASLASFVSVTSNVIPLTTLATSSFAVASEGLTWLKGCPMPVVPVEDRRFLELTRTATYWTTAQKAALFGAAVLAAAKMYAPVLIVGVATTAAPTLLVTAAITGLFARYVKDEVDQRQNLNTNAYYEGYDRQMDEELPPLHPDEVVRGDDDAPESRKRYAFAMGHAAALRRGADA